MGQGNDTFVRLATSTATTTHWLRECVQDYGPILVSMLGRLYHEKHDKHFAEAFPIGISKFLQEYLGDELNFEDQKGQEQLVDLTARGDARYFVKGRQRRKTETHAESQGPRVEGRLACPGVPYKPGDKVLVVGDADFSWSLALANLWGRSGAEGLMATSYESRKQLEGKYPEAKANIKVLARSGAEVLHTVDATKLGQVGERSGKVGSGFNAVVFNFPHTGTDQGLEASIEANKALLQGFFEAAPALLAKGKKTKAAGELHVTLVNRFPYTAWKAAWVQEGPSLEQTGLEYLGCREFDASDYPGYQHQATSKIEDGVLDVATKCMTHAWRLKTPPTESAAEPAADDNQTQTDTDKPKEKTEAADTKKEPKNKKAKMMAKKKMKADATLEPTDD